jgi:hypothetical protein
MVAQGVTTMQNSRSGRAALLLAAGFAALAAGGVLAQAPAPKSTWHIGTTYCSKMAVAATMPTDFVPGGSVDFQLDADCYAWMEFFYLNWRAAAGQIGVPDPSASPAQFGAPATSRAGIYPTVWESYHSADGLFASTALRLRGAPPSRPGVKVLAATSEFLGAEVHFRGIQEASGGWLTDRRGNLTYYEVHVDNDEYGYIVGNGLTHARNQVACANGPAGFSLPHGAGTTTAVDYACSGKPARYGMNFGAIEIKAAWIELPDPATWPNYKISLADIYAPRKPVRHNVVIGLVGLHVIHKTPSAQQMVWATFEHVDNDPVAVPSGSPTPTPPPRGWTFYRNDCNPATDHYQCVPNTSPRPCPTVGPCQDPYNAPIQVVRTTPIDPFSEEINTSAYRLMTNANDARSVFKHYRLVQVLWPGTPVAVPSPRATVPLSDAGTIPTGPVANTTLETYVQGSRCFDCHKYATVATPSPLLGSSRRRVIEIPAPGQRTAKRGSSTLASDYSFIFGDAH